MQKTNKLFFYFVILTSILVVGGTQIVESYASSDIISQDKIWDAPIKFHAIYTESGIETSFLEVGQQAYIVFPLRQNEDGGPLIEWISAGYQIVEDKDFPRYDDKLIEVQADSLDLSKPLSASFIPLESGSYFLRQTMSYEYKDSDNSGHLGGGNRNFVVVEEFSNALDDEGKCNNTDLFRYIKQDLSNAVCVTQPTFVKLLERGY